MLALNYAIKTIIYLLVFLLPLFFLPFTFEAFEFNKQYLLFFLVSLGVSFWFARMIIFEKRFSFRWTPLDIFVLAFLSVAILSTIFSVDRISSIFGFYGRFSDGLIGLISLIAFYFLITNNNITKNSLVKVFLWSSSLVILISYLSIFGIWQKISTNLPAFLFQRTFNPVSGSPEGLAMFLSVMVALVAGFLIFLKWNFKQLGYWLFLLFALGILIIVDFSFAWITLIVSLSLFLIFALVKRIFKEGVNRLLILIFLISISVTFLFLDSSKFSNIFLPKERVLEQGISWQISLGGVKDNLKMGALGSGIGTWYYDFSKFKPENFNLKPWWQIRFDRAGSHISEILGTMGVLGLILYLGLVGFLLLISWFSLKNQFNNLPLIMALLALVVANFVYYQNTTLAFTFWLILGLLVISWQPPAKSWWVKEKTISFQGFPELNLIFSTILLFFLLVILGSYYFGIRFYLADLNYAKTRFLLPGQELSGILEKSIGLNPKLSVYPITQVRTYLFQLQEEKRKPIESQDLTKISALMASSTTLAKKATEISPNYVVAWETLGMAYRELQFLVQGATEWGIKSFEKAIELEPKNPILLTELGKLYLNLGNVEKAKENFSLAGEMNPNYIDGQIQYALLFERENNLDEATKRIEELVFKYPFDFELRFQLGRLYFNLNKVDDAILQFENAILLFPNHSNSLYSLALAFEKKGEIEKAIFYFEKVLELNPGNQEVKQKLEALRK